MQSYMESPQILGMELKKTKIMIVELNGTEIVQEVVSTSWVAGKMFENLSKCDFVGSVWKP